MGRLRQLIFEYDRIKQEPQYQLNLLNGLPNVPYVSTCFAYPSCRRAQVCFTFRKIENIGFNLMKVRSLMFSMVVNFNLDLKLPIFNLVPKILNFSVLKVKTTLINAEGQNNTFKTTKVMPKVRNTSRHF